MGIIKLIEKNRKRKMISNAYHAAAIFGRIYGEDMAKRVGFWMEHPRLRQSADDVSAMSELALTWGTNLANLNKGMMSQMQADPSDTDNDCYTNTVATNAELLILADFESYVLGGFDAGTFADQLKVMQIKFMQQVEACNFTQYLIASDAMLNNIPNFAAASMNFATQVGTGFEEADTSSFIAYQAILDGNDLSGVDTDAQYEKYGEGWQLFTAELLKISAEESSIEVSPVGL